MKTLISQESLIQWQERKRRVPDEEEGLELSSGVDSPEWDPLRSSSLCISLKLSSRAAGFRPLSVLLISRLPIIIDLLMLEPALWSIRSQTCHSAHP